MRFLKVNLFRTYSLNEQVSQKISLALSRYKKHLSVYKDKIDKNLFNFYNETDRFHDYQIVELSYKFDSCNKKSKILSCPELFGSPYHQNQSLPCAIKSSCCALSTVSCE